MKNYLKGLLSGLLIAAVLCCVPAFAENIQALFNQIRINVNGIDIAQWGESYTLESGEEVPYSISYRDTTYLPLRKIGEINDKKVYWNGDSNTASMTGYQSEINELAEKPDNNGNIWTYYTFKADGDTYLGVKDKTRGYERVYKLMSAQSGNSSVCLKDDCIYFVRFENKPGKEVPRANSHSAALYRIDFNNDKENQDGELIADIPNIDMDTAIFDGDYLFYFSYEGSMVSQQSVLNAYNINNMSEVCGRYSRGNYHAMYDLTIVESGILRFKINTDETYQITFDKTSNTFSEPIKVE